MASRSVPPVREVAGEDEGDGEEDDRPADGERQEVARASHARRRLEARAELSPSFGEVVGAELEEAAHGGVLVVEALGRWRGRGRRRGG